MLSTTRPYFGMLGLYTNPNYHWLLMPVIILLIDVFFKKVVYEGRSICNENSPVYPKVLYLQTS